jgi:hypothetical protein
VARDSSTSDPKNLPAKEATGVDREDPFLDELLDEVLAVHRDLPDDVLAEMRLALRLIALTHPVGSAIVDRARPRAAPFESGAVTAPARSRDAQASANAEPVVEKKKDAG